MRGACWRRRRARRGLCASVATRTHWRLCGPCALVDLWTCGPVCGCECVEAVWRMWRMCGAWRGSAERCGGPERVYAQRRWRLVSDTVIPCARWWHGVRAAAELAIRPGGCGFAFSFRRRIGTRQQRRARADEPRAGADRHVRYSLLRTCRASRPGALPRGSMETCENFHSLVTRI